MRLDTICFSLGFAPTIAAARQLVNHGHITVDNKVVDIPSFQCQLADIINVKPKTRSEGIVTANLERVNWIAPPSHLSRSMHKSKVQGIVKRYVNPSEILLDLNELLVIEYYSRR